MAAWLLGRTACNYIILSGFFLQFDSILSGSVFFSSPSTRQANNNSNYSKYMAPIKDLCYCAIVPHWDIRHRLQAVRYVTGAFIVSK